jgi:hypothetical protein
LIAPPIGTTCATPETPSRRRRTSHSAASRSAPSDTPSSAVSPTNMISPMIDDAGAISGSTPAGSAERVAASFSVTT